MKKFFFCLFGMLIAFLPLASLAAEEDKEKDSPKVEEILDKMAKSIHLEKMKSVKNVSVKAKIHVKKSTTVADIFKPPAKDKKTQDEGGSEGEKTQDGGVKAAGSFESIVTHEKAYNKIVFAGQLIEMGYDGSVAWSKMPMIGVTEAKGHDREQILGQTLETHMNLASANRQMQLGADEKFNGRDCYVLAANAEDPSARKMFIDKETFFINGVSQQIDTPLGKRSVKTIFEDYKETKAGFLLANKTVMDMGQMVMIYLIESVAIDDNVDESIFSKPDK